MPVQLTEMLALVNMAKMAFFTRSGLRTGQTVIMSSDCYQKWMKKNK